MWQKLKNKINSRTTGVTHQGFPDVISGPPGHMDSRPSLDINQINENLKLSKEPQEIEKLQRNESLPNAIQSEMNHRRIDDPKLREIEERQAEGARRASLPDLTVYDLKDKKVLNKKISLGTVQQLLSQKKFVKDLMEENNEFLKIVTAEVKSRVKDELKGRGDIILWYSTVVIFNY